MKNLLILDNFNTALQTLDIIMLAYSESTGLHFDKINELSDIIDDLIDIPTSMPFLEIEKINNGETYAQWENLKIFSIKM